MIIELKPATCKHCGSGRRTIDIIDFKKDYLKITESTLNIWKGKHKCWVCKKEPEIDETWGLSINKGEKNRLYCSICSTVINNKLEGKVNTSRFINIRSI